VDPRDRYAERLEFQAVLQELGVSRQRVATVLRDVGDRVAKLNERRHDRERPVAAPRAARRGCRTAPRQSDGGPPSEPVARSRTLSRNASAASTGSVASGETGWGRRFGGPAEHPPLSPDRAWHSNARSGDGRGQWPRDRSRRRDPVGAPSGADRSAR
jgi:hypothetical protein